MQAANVIANAATMGIEGVDGFTRAVGSTSSISNFEMKFRSEKLPKLTQKVYSINGTTYNDGDVAYPGDTVIFEVTLSSSAQEYQVNYEGTLTTELSGAVFLGTSPTGTGSSSTQSASISSTSAYSQTYYVQYTIPNAVSTNITDVVKYEYESYPNSNIRTTSSSGTALSYKITRDTLTSSATARVYGVIDNTYITISKNVAGNMRNSDKYFKFNVVINGTNGDIYTIQGQDAIVSYDGNDSVSTSSSYTVGQTNYIYLKSGQTATIGLANNNSTLEVPVGITYTITELDAEDYTTTINGGSESKTTGTLTTAQNDNTLNFLNTKDAAALTGKNIKIISKIENRESLEEIDKILNVSDGIIISRGDLGIEISLEKIPRLQKSLTKKIKEKEKICIISTEMLSSMKSSVKPTRAEVSDIANAVLDNVDALMLGEETAIGNYPLEAVKIMKSSIEDIERDINYKEYITNLTKNKRIDISKAISYASCEAACMINAGAIVCSTLSGSTAKDISNYRPSCPIIAISPNSKVVRGLSINYGIIPMTVGRADTTDELVELSKRACLKALEFNNDDRIVIVGTFPLNNTKYTNFMKIEDIKKEE